MPAAAEGQEDYLGQAKPPVPSLHSAPMYAVPSMPSGLRCAKPIRTCGMTALLRPV